MCVCVCVCVCVGILIEYLVDFIHVGNFTGIYKHEAGPHGKMDMGHCSVAPFCRAGMCHVLRAMLSMSQF